MTYNFDPDRWHENEQQAIRYRLDTGRISQDAFEGEMADLDRRYDQMLERLDGTYQLPDSGGDPK